MSEQLNPCCCGSASLKELKPYGIESVQCGDCHVSLRKKDWNRVMQPRIQEGYDLIPKTGSYCLVSRWSDIDPRDPWSIGMLCGIQIDKAKTLYKVEGEGCLDRWFQHCKVITSEEGEIFIKAAKGE